jgi:Tol biopolymer transport system component
LFSVAQKISEPLPVKLAHVERLHWSPDGTKLLLAGSDRRARNGVFVYDIASASTSPLHLENEADFRGVDAAWSADGDAVWFVRQGKSLVLHELESGKERTAVQAGPDESIRLPAASPDGESVVYALLRDSGGGDVFVWDPKTRKSKHVLLLSSGRLTLTDLGWSPDGKDILVGTNSSVGLRLYHVAADGASMRAGPVIASLTPGTQFSADGKKLLVTTGNESEEVWVIEHAANPAGR